MIIHEMRELARAVAVRDDGSRLCLAGAVYCRSAQVWTPPYGDYNRVRLILCDYETYPRKFHAFERRDELGLRRYSIKPFGTRWKRSHGLLVARTDINYFLAHPFHEDLIEHIINHY